MKLPNKKPKNLAWIFNHAFKNLKVKSKNLKVGASRFQTKMFLLTFHFLLFTFNFTIAQQLCDCRKEFAFVRQHMEKNHPGFASDIKRPSEPKYKAFVRELEKKIAADSYSKYCIAYLKQYLFYLKDHHINITGNATPVNEDSLPAVEAFLKSPVFLATERISFDTSYFSKVDKAGLEGIYKSPDGTYTIGLVKMPNQRRDYAGIILSSATKLWQPGQVKLELKQVNDSIMQVYSYLRNHSLSYDEVRFNAQTDTDLPGWVKVYPAGSTASTEVISRDIFSFKILDSNTAYIAIRSFAGRYATMLDSAYKAVMPEIRKRRYLIIDVRNNGGGSDVNYKALMPLIYTGPITNDVIDYYATPGNVQAYLALRDLYKSKPEIYGQNGYLNWQYGMGKMSSAKRYSFVPMVGSEPTVSKYTPVEGYPSRVAIVYNRNCASSCEAFLFEARQSTKIITVGENSGGYTGYGNVMQITTPCGNNLGWTTTRYRNNRRYDFTGIPPQYRVPQTETDWVRYARTLISQ
jgi:hypothetical protein